MVDEIYHSTQIAAPGLPFCTSRNRNRPQRYATVAAFGGFCEVSRKTRTSHEIDMANRQVTVTTNKGDFRIELFEARAPRTTANFISLVEKGFYDGVPFHRVIDGFMIQGGCPEGSGRGGPGYTIDDEFHPELRHEGEGVLSMANAGPDTGGSQFFITLADTPWLDGKHAIFGKVVEGMETIREIGKAKTDRGDRPVDEIVMEKVAVADSESE
jgi:cyclophilin family peptidyl-prolyl cis-trans isomerase